MTPSKPDHAVPCFFPRAVAFARKGGVSLFGVAALLASMGVACGDDDLAVPQDASVDGSGVDSGPPLVAYPLGFPGLAVPSDNPMNAAKIELGRRLFYDVRLSANGKQSCGSCHDQTKNFTDGLPHAIGSTGEHHRRNSMSLSNVGYFSVLTWASDLQDSLEKQALLPLFGETPVELGNAGHEGELVARLASEPAYIALLPAAFPEDPRMSVKALTYAIAAFERTLVSGNAPYDRFLAGEKTAINEAAKRGADLFFGERAECFHCHGGFAFADSVTFAGKPQRERSFHNTGLYNIDGKGAYPPSDIGLGELSHRPEDMGRFRAPSLRNIAVSAPYMHDGSKASLEDAVRHYARGGTITSSGPNAGDGKTSPLKSELVRGFDATDAEIADLLAFLSSLTDDEFLHNPKFASPW